MWFLRQYKETRLILNLCSALFLPLYGVFGFEDREIVIPHRHRGIKTYQLFTGPSLKWVALAFIITGIGSLFTVIELISKPENEKIYKYFSWLLYGSAVLLFITAIGTNPTK